MLANINRQKLLFVFIIVLFLFSILYWQINNNLSSDALKTFEGMETHQIEIINEENQTLILQAKIADDNAEQQAGFQYVDKTIIEKTIILFIFQSNLYR